MFVPPEAKAGAKKKQNNNNTNNKEGEFPQNIKPDVVIVCFCVATFGRVVISRRAMWAEWERKEGGAGDWGEQKGGASVW